MSYEPPRDWPRLTTIDAHTAGEPLRVVVDGWPEPPGDSILAKRRWTREHADHLRRALMWEPRGHADMYGCLLTEPVSPDGDVGVLFLHNEGYSTMCGHGIIGLVKVGAESGRLAVSVEDPVVRIDTPAGRVTATAHFEDARAGDEGRRVASVSFLNVPSFVVAHDRTVTVRGHGDVVLDVAYGGAFYAVVDAARLGVSVDADQHAELVAAGMAVKRAVMDAVPLRHPDGDADLDFLYGTILVAPARDDAHHSRNVTVFADGEVDRSPTGTGVSARAAIHHARGELPVGRAATIESLIDTTFDVEVAEETAVGDGAAGSSVPAIVPRVSGRAWITGRHEFLLDPDDPLRGGVLLR